MTTLKGKLVRRVTLALGANWHTRGWPAGEAEYDVEISERGIRARLAPRGAWYAAEWGDVLPGLGEET